MVHVEDPADVVAEKVHDSFGVGSMYLVPAR